MLYILVHDVMTFCRCGREVFWRMWHDMKVSYCNVDMALFRKVSAGEIGLQSLCSVMRGACCSAVGERVAYAGDTDVETLLWGWSVCCGEWD